MPLATQFGMKPESVVGTAVVVDHFVPLLSDGIKQQMGTTQSKALVAGRRGPSAERRARYPLGPEGSVVFEVGSKGFGVWLKQMLGAVATSSVGTDGEYVHTGTVASLCGTSFTCQVNKPLGACGATSQAWTRAGCKLNQWTLENSAPDGLLTFTGDVVGSTEVTDVALASAVYPTGDEVLSWLGGLIKFGDVAIDVKSVKITVNNSLDTSRHFIRRNAARKEPVETDLRVVTVEATLDQDNLDFYNAYVATANSDNIMSFEGSWQAPTLIGDPETSTTYPELNVQVANLSIEDRDAPLSGPGIIEQTITGTGLLSGSDELITVAYTTEDSTP